MLYFLLTHQDIGQQVAGLINTHNELSTSKYRKDILKGKAHYVIETHGKYVLGAVGIEKQGYTFSEIKHLVVRPKWRGRGLGKLLVERAMSIAVTKMLYATVRSDNEGSLRLFESLGFSRAGEYAADDHKVILLVKVTPRWEKTSPTPEPDLPLSWSSAQRQASETSTRNLTSSESGK